MARQRNTPPAATETPATPTALAVRNRGIRRVRVADIVDNPKNYRTHDDLQRSSFRATVGEIGWYGYPDVFEHPEFPGRVMLIDGELRSHHLAEQYGPDAYIDVNVTDFSPVEADKALATKDPLAGMAGVEKAVLQNLLNELETGSDEFEALIRTLAEREEIELVRAMDGDAAAGGGGGGGLDDGAADARPEPAALRDRFIVPPFTTLDARQGYWRERRAAWMALGIASDLGRSVVTAEFGEAPPAPDRAELIRRIESGEVTWEWLSGHLGGTPGNIQMAITGYYDRAAAGESRAEILADWILTRPDAIRAVTPSASRVQLDLATVDRDELIAMLDDGRLRWDTVAGALGAVPSGPTAGIMDYYAQLRSGKTQNEIIADWILNQRTRTYNINDWAAENTSTRIAGGGVSIFDPVLCELAYRWFCPVGGAVLDPFAGGSVRGIVAGALGLAYTGIDLRPEQNEANERQWEAVAPALGPSAVRPRWITGNSLNLDELLPADYRADFVFSCPPYYDLEVYSDDPADLSNMDWDEFVTAYRAIVAAAVGRLRDNRFCGFVVGDLRDPAGNYRNFTGETVRAFTDAGTALYNEGIFITPASTLPLRAANQFVASRKLGKAHQNFYVFVRGDGRATTNELGPVEIAAEFLEPATGTIEPAATSDPAALTPVQRRGGYAVKRDDLFEYAGVRGGKVRGCLALAAGAVGLVTAGSRSSPQCAIVAAVGRELGLPVRLHTPTGELSPELIAARDAGAEIVQHRAGYNTVIVARAREDAAARGWTEIPFGMECDEAVAQTRRQALNLPDDVRRLVVPVGSGMSLSGILWGLADAGRLLPVLGVVVGADPTDRLNEYAPPDWRSRVTLVPSGVDYDERVSATLDGLALDPVYEAKCLRFLEPGDCLWVVGVRGSLTAAEPEPPRRWGVSAAWVVRRHNCTLEHIRSTCGGNCCRTQGFWPPKTTPTGCAHLTAENVCRFEERDRPVTCLLYPLRLNAAGTLILHSRAAARTSVCRNAHNHGPQLIDALASNLRALFGPEQYDRVRADVLAGRDSYFDVPDDVAAYVDAEADWERRNVPPPGRREFAGLPVTPPEPAELVPLQVPPTFSQAESDATPGPEADSEPPARRGRSYLRATGANPNLPPAPKPKTRRGRPRKK